ncbi:MAG TPA: hypothetical protein VEU47_11890 [Candidatus Cybelea sp.]|nr:hypothetical protein [Candidatus Cybelea sp.]
MKSFLMCLALLASLTGFAAAASAGDPPNVAVNVIHSKSQGVIRINGVPVYRFVPTRDGGSATDSIGVGQWLIDGENSIAVETRSKDGGSTRVVIVKTIDEPHLFDGEIAGAGATEYKLQLKDVPRWGWLDAEQWTGDNQSLLAAVGALHAAFDKGDLETIMRQYKAFADDMAPYIGPISKDDFAEPLKGGTVQPLPADLTVESFYDHRLFVVRRADGSAPIRVDNEAVVKGIPALESGQFWIRKSGQWQIIRP